MRARRVPRALLALIASLGFENPAPAQPLPPADPAAPAPPAAPATAPAPPASAPISSAPGDVATAAGPALSLVEVARTTLRVHPAIRAAEASLSQRRAELKAARGPFDPLFLARAGHAHDETPVLRAQRLVPEQRATLTDTTSLNLGASWVTTWGTAFLPSVGLARVHQRPADSLAIAGLPSDPVQQANVGLTLIQPLLRGAGSVGAASAIDAAKTGRDSGVHAIAFTAQQRVFVAVATYFQWVAAGQQVALLRDNAKVAEKLVAETRVLVEADQRPRTDLYQLEGNLAIRMRSVREAASLELQALYALGEAMGLSAERTPSWRPVDALPSVRPAPLDRARLMRQARLARRDVRAARDAVASNAALLTGAEFNTKPALDLSVSVGYKGALDDDGADAFFLAAGSNVPGVSAGVALSLELPIGNTAREAERDLRQAQYQQSKIVASDLERRIPLNVLSALDDVRMSMAQLEASMSAVQKFQQALAAEQDRVRESAGTVIDLVLTQEQLIRAELSQVADHLRYAVALARLEFELGAMPTEENAVDGALGRMFDFRARPASAKGGGSAGQ